MKARSKQLTIERPEEIEKTAVKEVGKSPGKTPMTNCSYNKNTTRSEISTTPKVRLRLNGTTGFETVRKEVVAPKQTRYSPEKTKRKSKSRGKSPYFTPSISEKYALEKVNELNYWQAQHNLRMAYLQVKAREDERRILQDRPAICDSSKELYETVRHRKHLSGNILHRFEQYEEYKVQHHLDNIILQHFEETHSVPSLKSLLRSHRDYLVRLLRSCSKQELLHTQNQQ